MALEADLLLREAQASAGGNADLLDRQVDAGHHLGHWMLDLKPGVHLDEVELAVFIKELDRAGATVLQVLHGLGYGIANLLGAVPR